MNTIRIALIQTRYHASPDATMDQAEALIESGVRQGASVVCLQELFALPYFCNVQAPERFDLAENIPGPITQRFSKLAKQHHPDRFVGTSEAQQLIAKEKFQQIQEAYDYWRNKLKG